MIFTDLGQESVQPRNKQRGAGLRRLDEGEDSRVLLGRAHTPGLLYERGAGQGLPEQELYPG